MKVTTKIAEVEKVVKVKEKVVILELEEETAKVLTGLLGNISTTLNHPKAHLMYDLYVQLNKVVKGKSVVEFEQDYPPELIDV